MYDLELSMSNNFYDEKTHTTMKWSKEKNYDIDKDFQEFINYSEENRLMVESFHNILTIDDVIRFMNDIENRGIKIDNEIKKKIILDFSEHYDKIENMLCAKKVK